MNIQIETKRLILRPITKNDTQDLFELDSNPEVHKYLGNKPVKTIEESEAIITKILDQYKIYGIGRLAVIDKVTNAFLGWSGLKYEQQLRKEFNYYDIGYRFKQQYWGKGYATESALASLEYGFKDLKLDEICAAADYNNLASNHILKKIGLKPNGWFTFEGDLCNWYTLKSKNYHI